MKHWNLRREKTPHQSVFDALCFSGVRMPNGLCLLNRDVRNTAAGKPPNSRHSDLPIQVSRMIFLLVGCFICFLESQWYLYLEDLEDFAYIIRVVESITPTRGSLQAKAEALIASTFFLR